jgi:hypothetical protein
MVRQGITFNTTITTTTTPTITTITTSPLYATSEH